MLALPTESFEPRRVAQATANSLSLVRFDRNDYSVPTAYAHHERDRLGGIEEVAHRLGHRRRGHPPDATGAGSRSPSTPVHYLALLERKPGALDYGPAP